MSPQDPPSAASPLTDSDDDFSSVEGDVPDDVGDDSWSSDTDSAADQSAGKNLSVH